MKSTILILLSFAVIGVISLPSELREGCANRIQDVDDHGNTVSRIVCICINSVGRFNNQMRCKRFVRLIHSWLTSQNVLFSEDVTLTHGLVVANQEEEIFNVTMKQMQRKSLK